MNELHHDYVFELLHNKKAIVYVKWGNEVKEYKGTIHARDPYSVLLDTDDGRWIISKGQIIAYKLLT
jgi:small nuclear ribonucleoprotein (snRNP)-like protein